MRTTTILLRLVLIAALGCVLGVETKPEVRDGCCIKSSYLSCEKCNAQLACMLVDEKRERELLCNAGDTFQSCCANAYEGEFSSTKDPCVRFASATCVTDTVKRLVDVCKTTGKAIVGDCKPYVNEKEKEKIKRERCETTIVTNRKEKGAPTVDAKICVTGAVLCGKKSQPDKDLCN
jgi:hypothetical protein